MPKYITVKAPCQIYKGDAVITDTNNIVVEVIRRGKTIYKQPIGL